MIFNMNSSIFLYERNFNGHVLDKMLLHHFASYIPQYTAIHKVPFDSRLVLAYLLLQITHYSALHCTVNLLDQIAKLNCSYL